MPRKEGTSATSWLSTRCKHGLGLFPSSQEARNVFGPCLLPQRAMHQRVVHSILFISTVLLKLVCVWGRTHQANILSWSQNILPLPLLLGVKGWIRCKGQFDTFHLSTGSWICMKQYQVQEYRSVSFSGWDLNTSNAKASGTMGVKSTEP